MVTVFGLPDREPGAPAGVFAGLRSGALMRPAVIFAGSAAAAGVVVTYVPLAVAGWAAPAALLIQPAMSTAVRYVAGRLGDRYGQLPLLVPAAVLCVLGMATMAATESPLLVLAGAALLGAGFGIMQNATLTLMYARVPAEEYATVSALWNAAYDLGMAAGAIGVGMIAANTGYPVAFLATAALLVPAVAMARRERGYSPRIDRRISSNRDNPALCRASN